MLFILLVQNLTSTSILFIPFAVKFQRSYCHHFPFLALTLSGGKASTHHLKHSGVLISHLFLEPGGECSPASSPHEHSGPPPWGASLNLSVGWEPWCTAPRGVWNTGTESAVASGSQTGCSSALGSSVLSRTADRCVPQTVQLISPGEKMLCSTK